MALTKISTSMYGGKPFNVRAYGAAGDGVSDDTSAIQAAVDAAGENGVVYIPAGEYYINVNTGILLSYDNFTLYGDGPATKIKVDPASQKRGFTIASDVASSNPSSVVSNVVIRDILIDGMADDASATVDEFSHGINARKCSKVFIQNVSCINVRGDGVFIGYGAENVTVDGCYLESTVVTGGVKNYRQGVAVLSGRDIIISNNVIVGWLLGIDLECDDNQISFGYDFVENITIKGNIVKNCQSEGIGILTPLVTSAIDVRNISIEGNVLDNISETAIEITGSSSSGSFFDIAVSDNVVQTSSTFKGIEISYVSDSLISGNVLHDIDDYGIHVATECSDIAVIGNSVRNSGNIGISVTNTTTTTREKFVVADNFVRSSSNSHPGIFLNGCIDANVSGNTVVSASSSVNLQGRSGLGDAGRAAATLTGNNLQSTGTICFVVSTDVLNVVSSGNRFDSASGETYTASTASGGTLKSFWSGNIYSIDEVIGTPSLINDQRGNAKIIDYRLSEVETYTTTNVSTDRSYDADSTTTAELADVLGTLIADLKTAGILT